MREDEKYEERENQGTFDFTETDEEWEKRRKIEELRSKKDLDLACDRYLQRVFPKNKSKEDIILEYLSDEV